MNAASGGFRNPNAARPTPMLSTTNVPTKFCMIVLRQRRAVRRVSTSFDRSLPMSTTSALSRATSVPDPMATPTDACINAGASFTPSPTITTLWPSATAVSHTATCLPAAGLTQFHLLPIYCRHPVRLSWRLRQQDGPQTHGLQRLNRAFRLGSERVCNLQRSGKRPPRATKISEPLALLDLARSHCTRRSSRNCQLPTMISSPSLVATIPLPGVYSNWLGLRTGFLIAPLSS